ncbi:MAG: helix-turn-helix domain-containing protein [Propionibacteriaceae bacterium]|jgi:excisionase family DNA binding protein|nr:helix-turn-helix domain-containing protein [Propionibacteriaceae bacterium]
MSTLQSTTAATQQIVIPAASVALNPSWESDWGRAVYGFVRRASDEGKTVTISVDERLYSPQEAADLADVSRMTIRRRIEEGAIKATKRGSRWRIAESELERYRRQMWADTVTAMADDF